MGTPEFAVPSLQLLCREGIPVTGVVTGADKPRGRGQTVTPTPVASFAREAGLPLMQPGSLRDEDFRRQLSLLYPDLLVVVAFRILPPEIFRIPRLGAFNLHASLLPRYRGAAPIQRAIMNGETQTGLTTFLLAEKVDTGSLLLQLPIPIEPEENAGSLHDRLADAGGRLVLDTVRKLERGELTPMQQDDSFASPAPKITRGDCLVDWSRRAVVIHNQVRALSPSPAAFTSHNRKQLKLFRTTVSDRPASGPPGTVVLTAETMSVCTGDLLLSIREIRQEGRGKMGIGEFLRGYRISSGDRLE